MLVANLDADMDECCLLDSWDDDSEDVLEHVAAGLGSLVLGRTVAWWSGDVEDMGDVGERLKSLAIVVG